MAKRDKIFKVSSESILCNYSPIFAKFSGNVPTSWLQCVSYFGANSSHDLLMAAPQIKKVSVFCFFIISAVMVHIAAKTRLSTKSRCVLETGALCIKFAMTMTAIVTSADLWPQHNDSLSYSACWYSLYKRIRYKQYTSTFNSSTFTSSKFKKKEGRTRRFTSEKWKPMQVWYES